jgi:hypothetical protein
MAPDLAAAGAGADAVMPARFVTQEIVVPEHIHRACFFTGAWCKVFRQ